MGVVLVEKGKSVKSGTSYQVDGKFKLDEYRKMHDVRKQQVSDNIKMKRSDTSNLINISKKGLNEDPYRTFQRELINQSIDL